MQAVRSAATTVRRALPLAVVGVVLAAGPGYANDDTGHPPPSSTAGPSGTSHNGSISAFAAGNTGKGYSLDPAPGKLPAGKQLGSSDVNWTPPPCWIGPIADPASFKKMIEQQVKNTDVPGQANYAMEAMDELQRHYSKGYTWDGGGKGYKNYNLDQQGKGMFWGPVENPDSDSPDKFDCNSTLPFWVPTGEEPPGGTPNVITPEMLSKIAANHTRVPGVTIETSPTDGQTVNLPTWVWLREDYTPVHVRAYVDLGGGRQIWAETTAEPVSVRIDPGTPDATVFPSSGQCPIGKDGSVGVKYTGNAEAAPPCGVTYRRSTQNRPPFQLNVTATWRVTWVGSDGGGVHPLADGVIDNPRPVTVQEIQSVNR